MNVKESVFQFTAHSQSGKTVKGTVQAANETDAFKKASRSGLTVTGLVPVRTGLTTDRTNATRKTQIDLLRQFAVMIGARVDAASALAALGSSAVLPAIKASLEEAAIQLRRGEPLGHCLGVGIPGLSANIRALIEAGERGGCLAETASHAVQQLEAEERISASIKSSMIYPTFLVTAGLLAGILMLTMVIPRFAELLGDERENLTGLSWLVFELGDIASASYGLALLLPPLLLALISVRAFGQNQSEAGVPLARYIPVLSQIYLCRERERWCRIMAFALASRIAILDAVSLASAGVGDPKLHLHAQATMRDLRLGARVGDAVKRMQLFDETHLSLVRVGEESGALAGMFSRIAQDAEAELQEKLKRSTIILEQAVTIIVSVFIGLIVYGLVSSLTSIYEAIGQ
jgi:general secretion pathway protein F